MVHGVRPRAACTQGGLVVEVAAHLRDFWAPAESFGESGTAHQGDDAITARTQCLDQVSTDKAGATGHKDVHSGLS